MAKSKYTPENVEKILNAIRNDGCDKSGWLAGGICCDTFYNWKNQYIEFSESVAIAKDEYRKYCPEEVTRKAREKLVEALEYGQTIKRRSRVTKRVEHYDKEGELICTRQETEESDREDQMPPAKWAIERVLPKMASELEALEVLVASGWIPKEVLKVAANGVGELREKIEQAFKGIIGE